MADAAHSSCPSGGLRIFFSACLALRSLLLAGLLQTAGMAGQAGWALTTGDRRRASLEGSID